MKHTERAIPCAYAYAKKEGGAWANKTLRDKYDFASLFKRVIPEHTLLWIKTNTEPMRVWVCQKHEGHSKQTKHWNHANMTVSRSLSVWPKNIRFNLARRKFATSSVYDKQITSGRLVAEVRARNKQITEHTEAWLWLVHNVGDKS